MLLLLRLPWLRCPRSLLLCLHLLWLHAVSHRTAPNGCQVREPCRSALLLLKQTLHLQQDLHQLLVFTLKPFHA